MAYTQGCLSCKIFVKIYDVMTFGTTLCSMASDLSEACKHLEISGRNDVENSLDRLSCRLFWNLVFSGRRGNAKGVSVHF